MTWYAIKTAPQLERRADEALRAEGIETFMPMIINSAHRDRNGRRRPYSTAMMPGYVLVKGCVPWRLIVSAKRYGKRLMWSVLMAAGTTTPRVISNAELAVLRKFDGAPQPAHKYKAGDVIKRRVGRLSTSVDVIVTEHDEGVIHGLYYLLGQANPITLDEGQVEAA